MNIRCKPIILKAVTNQSIRIIRHFFKNIKIGIIQQFCIFFTVDTVLLFFNIDHLRNQFLVVIMFNV